MFPYFHVYRCTLHITVKQRKKRVFLCVSSLMLGWLNFVFPIILVHLNLGNKVFLWKYGNRSFNDDYKLNLKRWNRFPNTTPTSYKMVQNGTID